MMEKRGEKRIEMRVEKDRKEGRRGVNDLSFN
jgi:hypothetical protein